jgi:hypothetical protein
MSGTANHLRDSRPRANGWRGTCPYQKSGTCCRRCRCGLRLIPSAGACPRCSSPCSPPYGPSLGRVWSSRRRSSRSGINSPSSNARRQRDPGLVAPIAGCGSCCRGCRVAQLARRHPDRHARHPSCAGIVAASPSTGCGSHARDGRAGRVGADIRALIRQMHAANPLWGGVGTVCLWKRLAGRAGIRARPMLGDARSA